MFRPAPYATHRAVSVVAVTALVVLGASCGADVIQSSGSGASVGGTGPSDPTSGGAGAGGVGGHGGGEAGSSTVCPEDCSQLPAPPCHVSVCNEGQFPPPFGCVVVAFANGRECDDGAFCTTNDRCESGACVGDPLDCGPAGPCTTPSCDEVSDSCVESIVADDTPCVSDDLCLVATTCQGGVCEGTSKDCFPFPIPDNGCWWFGCNPPTGMCEFGMNPNGIACGTPCRTGATCTDGVCWGGGPKDCSALSSGCQVGVCEGPQGTCVAQGPTADCTVTYGGTGTEATVPHSSGSLLLRHVYVQTPIQVASVVVLAATAGAQARLGIYADAGGSPNNLLAQAATTTLSVGANEVAVPATPLSPGDYWIGMQTDIGVELQTVSWDQVVTKSTPLTFGDPFPDPFPTIGTGFGSRVSVFLKGTP